MSEEIDYSIPNGISYGTMSLNDLINSYGELLSINFIESDETIKETNTITLTTIKQNITNKINENSILSTIKQLNKYSLFNDII